jgi:Protein of unknown function (DUF3551)
MRTMLFVAAAMAMFSVDLCPAKATEGPWCAWVTIGGDDGIENCSMRTFEMCRQEITGGNRGSCYPNPHIGGSPRELRSRHSPY